MAFTISIDFDGTLVEKGSPLRWRPGAKEALAALAAAGNRLVLHSCRCNPVDPALDPAAEAAAFYRWGIPPESTQYAWDAFAEMRTFLILEGAWGLFAEVWQAPGKPIADVYVDDRGEAPDWRALAAEFGVAPRVVAGVPLRP